MKNKFLLLTTLIFLQTWFTSVSARDAANIAHEYAQTKDSVKVMIQRMKTRYRQCNSNSERNVVLKESAEFVFNTLTDDIFPAWYGTPWDFNGVSRTPGRGAIACGGFVVFTMQDAGFKIPTRMYRQPSENIIKNLTSASNIKRFSNNAPMDKIINWIQSKGEGLFIVGLDFHVGFIIYKNNKMTFCHSSYYNPPLQVINQDIKTKSPLTDSNYRVIGKMLTKGMMQKWILQEKYEVKYDYFKR